MTYEVKSLNEECGVFGICWKTTALLRSRSDLGLLPCRRQGAAAELTLYHLAGRRFNFEMLSGLMLCYLYRFPKNMKFLLDFY